MVLPQMSFIIPHRDDPLLDRLLNSLQNQSCKDFDVIVVDSSDNDKAMDVLSKKEKLPNLKIIAAKCGRGTARNIGAKTSKAEILVFVDADVVLPPWFVERLADTFRRDAQIVAVGFPIYPATAGKVPDAVYRFLRFLDEFSFRYGKPRIPTTCAAYRRRVFESRFFLDIVGEDVLFSADIGKYGKAMFSKRIMVFEEPRRWDRFSEIPKSLWHYIPAFAANILILAGLHNKFAPRQEIKE